MKQINLQGWVDFYINVVFNLNYGNTYQGLEPYSKKTSYFTVLSLLGNLNLIKWRSIVQYKDKSI